jgi:hypothetical protein
MKRKPSLPEKKPQIRTHTASVRRQAKADAARAHLQTRDAVTGKSRRENLREQKQRFLIVCEGERTEPLYFQGFRVSDQPLGLGLCTVSLVREAIRLRDLKDAGYYDQCWVVFDKDEFPDADFHEAIALAEYNGFSVAYTNQAFELWYLLHFDYHETAYDRSQYAAMLIERLGRTYQKNDPKMYRTLMSKQEMACKNAERLIETYVAHNPAADNPSTTVHLLVQELRKNSGWRKAL